MIQWLIGSDNCREKSIRFRHYKKGGFKNSGIVQIKTMCKMNSTRDRHGGYPGNMTLYSKKWNLLIVIDKLPDFFMMNAIMHE